MQELEQQIPLPYYQIEAVPNRETARAVLKDVGGKLGRQTMIVPIGQLLVRPGFNGRIQPEGMSEEQWLYDPNELDIASFARGIHASNGHDPLEVDMTPEGTFIITDGFRRSEARKRLIKDGVLTFPNGDPVDMVEVLVNPKETTELDRMKRIFTSQNNKKLKPMETALLLLRIKQTYGASNDEIASITGMSRQWVDGKIALTAQPDSIKRAIEDGSLSQTAALQLNREVKSDTERANMVEESIAAGNPIRSGMSRQESKERRENKGESEGLFNEGFGKVSSKKKADAEFGCNSIITKADKIRPYLKGLNKQNADDVDKLLDWIVKDAEIARDFIRSIKEK